MAYSSMEKVRECMDCFKAALTHYFEHGLGDELDAMFDKTRRAESSCDDYRREIELWLYERAHVPEPRGDILGLLEAIDKIPNKAESILYQIQRRCWRGK